MATKKPQKPGRTTPPRHPVRRPDERLDAVLVERGLFLTRSQAAASILAGAVLVEGVAEHKAGRRVRHDIQIDLYEEPAYVSRGGYKLERALEAFDVDVAGRVALDSGASTGGFTDCLLQNGATRVIAVDVGYGQLNWNLRNDDRVQVMERTNLRYLKCEELSAVPSLATLDLSFISLTKVLPALMKCLEPGFEIVALVKPQFEAGKGKVGKGGIVRDRGVHREVLLSIWDFAEGSGLRVQGLVDSPVRSPKGNVEYLMYLIDGSGDEARVESRSTPPLTKEEVVDEVLATVAMNHKDHFAGRAS